MPARERRGFVLLAALMRPVGGMLADRWGGARVLVGVFVAIGALGALIGCPLIPTFTVGVLGAAAALGLGNGAVFKLVPEHFPKETETVTGLVGAFGGLGGFFPPLVLGVIREIIHLCPQPTFAENGMKMRLRWWRDVLILSQPKRYLDDR